MVHMHNKHTHKYFRVFDPDNKNFTDENVTIKISKNKTYLCQKLKFLAVAIIEGSKKNNSEDFGSTGLNQMDKFNRARARSDGQLEVSIVINGQLSYTIYSNMIRNKGSNIQTKSLIKKIEYTDKELNIHLVKRLSLYPDELYLIYENMSIPANYGSDYKKGIYTFPKTESMNGNLTKQNINFQYTKEGIEITPDKPNVDTETLLKRKTIQKNIEQRKIKKLKMNFGTSPIMKERINQNIQTPTMETGNSDSEGSSIEGNDRPIEKTQYDEIHNSFFKIECDKLSRMNSTTFLNYIYRCKRDILEDKLSSDEDCPCSPLESGQIQPPITCFDNPRYNQQATTSSSQYIALEEAEANI